MPTKKLFLTFAFMLLIFSSIAWPMEDDLSEIERHNIRHSPSVKSHTFKKSNSETIESYQTDLFIKGQGTIVVRLSEISLSKSPKFSVSFGTSSSLQSGQAFIFEISKDLLVRYEGQDGARKEILNQKSATTGIDIDPNCPYWFSIDSHNRKLIYGKGEIRKHTALLEHNYSPCLSTKQKEPNSWEHELQFVFLEGDASSIDVWRDPVVIDPPLAVIDSDKMTMDMAASYFATVPANLTLECQKLYANIGGKSFVLNTSDFPEFTDAIEQSIRDSRGWCHRKLKEKASEFGKKEEKMTYLRITMGINQGNSPGVPFVLTIWPGGHYSPIHNHADANAIIRVLHGEVTVELFPFLSLYHQSPFMRKTLRTNDVTWLAPQYNQTHRVINHNENGPVAITVESYLYGLKDYAHQEYFDYIDNNAFKICQFNPTSDMDFLEFKKRMRDEWRGIFTSVTFG